MCCLFPVRFLMRQNRNNVILTCSDPCNTFPEIFECDVTQTTRTWKGCSIVHRATACTFYSAFQGLYLSSAPSVLYTEKTKMLSRPLKASQSRVPAVQCARWWWHWQSPRPRRLPADHNAPLGVPTHAAVSSSAYIRCLPAGAPAPWPRLWQMGAWIMSACIVRAWSYWVHALWAHVLWVHVIHECAWVMYEWGWRVNGLHVL